MAVVFDMAWQGYQLLFEELPDPRTKGWFLISKPYQILTLLGLYLMLVLKWAPKHMKNRQPYNLDKLLIVYNGFQVVACFYLVFKGVYLAWGWHYKWICEPVDFSNDPRSQEIAKTVYFYFILKLFDLLDTVFFVLRKKFNQVTFLHIYHHTGMCLLIWAAATYLPGGHGTLIGVINSFVHVVMYSYYLLTVAVPSIRNAIWIKKHVTQLQILQFCWYVFHMASIVFKTDCEFPRWTSAVFLPQNLFMLVLFVDFYIKTYIKKPREMMRAQMNTLKVSNQNNDTANNDNVAPKPKNSVNKLNGEKGIIDAKIYLKNDLSKIINGNRDDGLITNNCNEFSNGKESTCGSGKCKINCHKHYKNE